MTYFVYILECVNDTFYTGITNDIKRRYGQHVRGTGARYTKYNKPLKILYLRKCLNRKAAMKKEYLIKSWPRKRKMSLINGDITI